jgi:hypothetical protein
MRTLTLPPLELQVSVDQLCTRLGGRQSIPSNQAQRAQALIKSLIDTCQPQSRMQMSIIQKKSAQQVTLENDLTLTGAGIAGLLQGCEEAAAFVVTLGPEPQAMIQKSMKEGKLLDVMLQDAIASELVENLANTIQSHVEKQMAQKQRAITRRFSPGYCDFPIEDQKILDLILGFANIGIELNSSYLMIPEKSITAVFGIGPDNSLGKSLASPPPCGTCPKREHCPGQKEMENSR